MALITPGYLEEQRKLHTDPAFGSRGFNWAYTVAGIALIEKCRTILDYGCGKGTLSKTLRNAGIFIISSYDPGIPQFSARPNHSEFTVAVDVLEHIEPACLGDVLDDIAALTIRFLFVAIAQRPAKRFLSDGRNAHLIVEDEAWWRPKFEERGFNVRRVWLPTQLPEWTVLMEKRR